MSVGNNKGDYSLSEGRVVIEFNIGKDRKSLIFKGRLILNQIAIYSNIMIYVFNAYSSRTLV